MRALNPALPESYEERLLIIPMAYILFSARTGLAINEKFPIFDWENEVRPVKDSTGSTPMNRIAAASSSINRGPIRVLVTYTVEEK